jgi:hypothetical protein
MARMSALLAAPLLRDMVQALAGAADDPPVGSVVLVEALGDLVKLPKQALAVLTRQASAEAGGYRMDMAIKLAASRGTAGILLTDGRPQLPQTAVTIATSAGVAVLVAPADAALADVIVAVSREIHGDAAAALARVDEIVCTLAADQTAQLDVERLVDMAAPLFSGTAQLGSAGSDEWSAPVFVGGEVETHVSVSPEPGGHAAVVDRVALELLAGALGRAREAARRAEDVPVRSRGQLLTEFLVAAPDRGDRLLDRMRAADLRIDGWHLVLQIELEHPERLAGAGELPWYHVAERVSDLALDHMRPSGGAWHLAQLGSAFVLVRTTQRDPGAAATRDLLAKTNNMLDAVVLRIPKATLVCGVGTPHVGGVGLRTSAAEARAALSAARIAGRANEAVPYDQVGLERTLIEWYASDASREAVDSLLAPLDKLKPQKRDQSISTLKAYLDNQGSLSKTAENLHLHRNAVAYRVDRIFSALGIDRSDPDARLLLQLACRARSLG